MQALTTRFLMIASTLILLLANCNKVNNFSDNYSTSTWLRIKKPFVSETISYYDLSNSNFQASVDTFYGLAQKYEIYWQDTSDTPFDTLPNGKKKSKEYLVKSFVQTGTRSIQISPMELLKARNPNASNVNDLQNYISLGQTLQLLSYPYLNGQKIITQSNFSSVGTYNNFATFTIPVSCPFDINALVGSYEVIQDDWADASGDIRIESIPGSNNKYRILDYLVPPSPASVGSTIKDTLIVMVDLSTGKSTIEANTNFGKYNSGTIYSITGGTGYTFSCSGSIDLAVDIAPGYLGTKLKLKKR